MCKVFKLGQPFIQRIFELQSREVGGRRERRLSNHHIHLGHTQERENMGEFHHFETDASFQVWCTLPPDMLPHRMPCIRLGTERVRQ